MSIPVSKRSRIGAKRAGRGPLRRYRRGVSAVRLGSRVVWRATRLGAKAGEGRARLARKPPATTPLAATASAAIGGASAMYFLDPHGGRRRRHVAREKLFKLLRRRARDAERKARYASGVAAGSTLHMSFLSKTASLSSIIATSAGTPSMVTVPDRHEPVE